MTFLKIMLIAYVAVIIGLCYYAVSSSDYKATFHKDIGIYCRSEKPWGFNAKYGKEVCYELTELVTEQ